MKGMIGGVVLALALTACAFFKSPAGQQVEQDAKDAACVAFAYGSGLQDPAGIAQFCEVALDVVIKNLPETKKMAAKRASQHPAGDAGDAGRSSSLGPLERACVLADCAADTPPMHCNVAREHVPEAQQLLEDCLAAGEIGRRAKSNAASQEVGTE